MKRPANRKPPPLFVAVVGGSGAGKSWLAEHLSKALPERSTRLSVDNFYLDRSHLPAARRAAINYDHPRAIDWKEFRKVIRQLGARKPTSLPQYDFATHCREPERRPARPAPLIIVDGLWLLHRRWLRQLFDFSVFLDAPASLRLKRRLARDSQSRGRSKSSVREQFLNTVEPMHVKHVQPQAAAAIQVLKHPCGEAELARLVAALKALLKEGSGE